jgi:ribonuclease R
MENIQAKILEYLKAAGQANLRPRRLARQLDLAGEAHYGTFRSALRELMHQGRVTLGSGGAVVLPTQKTSSGLIVGTYKGNRKGFGFVLPSDPSSREDLYIPQGANRGALTGDIVSAKVTHSFRKEGKAMQEGRVEEILQRTHTRFVGTLEKRGTQWQVMPDGNVLPEPILTPDAGSRHIRAGTKVVVELTSWPAEGTWAQGVIAEVLGQPGDKDVDLRGVIVQHALPEKFSEACLRQARHAVAAFSGQKEYADRVDLTEEVICTIDPDDAKDYDDAISLKRLEGGRWELGVHIADVSHFIPPGSALDEESQKRGNSVYFPGYVIPMLPEVLSNGVCSLQEGVDRLCKSAFITLDADGRPLSAKFASTVIRSACRLRYREAQALIDGADRIPHPDGPRRASDYPREVVGLLGWMNVLAKRMQKRRLEAGQIVLDLPEIDLKLDEDGKVIGAEAEDTSFTHTLIEMFMVEANEAVARMLDALHVPFLRRIHPDPDPASSERLRHFVDVAGFRLPKDMGRKALQTLLETVRGKPQSFAINLAVLKSLARAEYSPKVVGHYALASQHYCHFTSPIRRYADLMIHRLLDQYIAARGGGMVSMPAGKRVELPDAIEESELAKIGKHISYTERRADDAEKELRQVKVLTLLEKAVGNVYQGVITGITNFGLFVQVTQYLIDGLVRYEVLGDDWWDVDDRAGVVRGQRTGIRLGIGDVVKTCIARVDVPRRELDLAILDLKGRDEKVGKKQHRKGGPFQRNTGGRGRR